jgi:hypothetical protein
MRLRAHHRHHVVSAVVFNLSIPALIVYGGILAATLILAGMGLAWWLDTVLTDDDLWPDTPPEPTCPTPTERHKLQ